MPKAASRRSAWASPIPRSRPTACSSSKDGKEILISIQSEREWKTLCAGVMDQPDLPADPRFANMVARVKQPRSQTRRSVDSFASTDPRRAAEAACRRRHRLCRSEYHGRARRHPHLRRIAVETPSGTVAYPAPAAILVGETRKYGAVPAIGDHRELTKSATREEIVMSAPAMRARSSTSIICGNGSAAQGSHRHRHRAARQGLRATLFQEVGEPKAGDAAPLDYALVPCAPVFPMRS